MDESPIRFVAFPVHDSIQPGQLFLGRLACLSAFLDRIDKGDAFLVQADSGVQFLLLGGQLGSSLPERLFFLRLQDMRFLGIIFGLRLLVGRVRLVEKALDGRSV